MKKIFAAVVMLAACGAHAQLPDTEIYVADFSDTKGIIKISSPVNITNRSGYDNQPSFSPDGNKIYYVSVRDTTQSDIYAYDLMTKKISQVTNTPVSEYSPLVSADGKSMTVVRVDADSGQRFYSVPLNGKSKPVFIAGTDSIGYYCRIDDNHYAMFLVGTANTLQILSLKDTSRKMIASDVGRCLRLSPDKKFLFYTLKSNDKEWKIIKLNLETYEGEPVIETLPASEDFAVLEDGTLLMAQGSKFFKFTPSRQDYWGELTDMGKTFHKITRLSINAQRNKIAFVDVVEKQK
jgi:hypothetical protein